MRYKFINYNGNILARDTPIFTSSSRAFRYGDGLFETMRLMNGKINFLSWHVERLLYGIKLLQINPEPLVSESAITTELDKLLAHNKDVKNGIIRLSAHRSGDGKYLPNTNNLNFIIELEDLKDNTYEFNDVGISLGIFDEIRKDVNAFSNIKSNNALVSVMGSIYAANNNYNDCLLKNTNDHIIEATSSNLFIVTGNKIETSPINAGCVDGIMRKVIICLCKKNQMILSERELSDDDIANADEIFLTNAAIGIKHANKFNEKTYSNVYAKQLTAHLNNAVYQ